MFKEEREELKFDWSMIGNIGEGRPNLGSTMDVSVYRLMQFTLRDVLIKQFDAETADRIFYEAGEHAGKADLENMNFTLTVAEDLDCSGLPASDETICTYDEGFISGLFSQYTGKSFDAEEVDCWCSGDRVCRFEAKQVA
jgi:predicted hydrocarbon binding protein